MDVVRGLQRSLLTRTDTVLNMMERCELQSGCGTKEASLGLLIMPIQVFSLAAQEDLLVPLMGCDDI